ncbi:MAG TPA: sodium transporter [Caldithrix abyssi]|uniref:Sodium transporter n=1 Tax=Caldithrix abyssi TaxID=187145 RepID=A0A7V4U048_CALAY|nr:sodium transporter [Caldithrix abyssi]
MMNLLDWLVIIVYLAGIVGFSVWLSRRQADTQDYYLAGRNIRWWQSGVSTMATQLSAISFVSAPAFVALKAGGGLKWLAYEFAVPLALILVMAVIIPVLHEKKLISIYEYLEQRFDSGMRTMVSVLFQIGRGLATAVAVLAGGIILSTAIGMSTAQAILLIGVVTLIYDVLGGIRVVILSDFIQMAIIFLGILICGSVAWYIVGWESIWAALPPERLQILRFDQWGFSSESTYGFWPMLIGGFFLYASYYGTDQSQVQRELTVGSLDDVRKSLLVNAFGRFPIVMFYVLMGVFVGAVFFAPHGIEPVAATMKMSVPDLNALLQRDPDRMVPMFILSYLPHGLIGFIFVAIMAALMSSLDSGLNSLSAVTMKDIYQKYIRQKASERHYLVASKMITVFWGLFCIGTALLLSEEGQATRQTTIVLINAVGSMLYGPILAAFLLGMFSKRVGAKAVKIGLAGGIAANLILWLFTSVSWMWWNVSGFLTAVGVAWLLSRGPLSLETPLAQTDFQQIEAEPSQKKWLWVYALTALYFFVIVAVSGWLER